MDKAGPGMAVQGRSVWGGVGQGGVADWGFAGGLLSGRGVSPSAAARLVLEALEESDSCRLETEDEVCRVRRIVSLGVEHYRQLQNTINFGELVEQSLHRKCHRRKRTLQEILQFAHRLYQVDPEWRMKPVRLAMPGECRRIIEAAFRTPVMRHKARTLMHGLFNLAVKQGWCNANPMDQVDFPPCREHRIQALDLLSVRRLLTTCLQDAHKPCAAALGFLVWAGIRPHELERLRWRHINLPDRIITIPPEHAKTGGARQVTMQPVLREWLVRTTPFRLPAAYIVPPSWAKRWRRLRLDAGMADWDADVLRHTFASYHLRHFRNLLELQVDMGHGSTDLLRTRYLNMDGVTTLTAKEYWGMDIGRLVQEATAPPGSFPAGGEPL